MTSFKEYLIESNFFQLSEEEYNWFIDFFTKTKQEMNAQNINKIEKNITFRNKNIKIIIETTEKGNILYNKQEKYILLDKYVLFSDMKTFMIDFVHELNHAMDPRFSGKPNNNPYFPYSKKYDQKIHKIYVRNNFDKDQVVQDPGYEKLMNQHGTEIDSIGAEIAQNLIDNYKQDDKIKEKIINSLREGKIPTKYIDFNIRMRIPDNNFIKKILLKRIYSLVSEWK